MLIHEALDQRFPPPNGAFRQWPTASKLRRRNCPHHSCRAKTMKTSKSVVLMSGLFAAGAALAATEPVPWPAGALDKQDPRVLAFYEDQCSRWADGQGLKEQERSAYLERCRVNVAKVYPVGYDESDDGGE
jgi:hypothetical protein